MEWHMIMTNHGWRVFPASIMETYLKWISSGNTPSEQTSHVLVDMPGMIMTDRTYQTIQLDGLSVEIPSQDFSILHKQLQETEEEIMPGGASVFKLRGWLAGLVLTPDQRHDLLSKMDEMLPSVRLIAQKENEEFCRRMDEVNKGGARVVSARHIKLKKDGPGDDRPN